MNYYKILYNIKFFEDRRFIKGHTIHLGEGTAEINTVINNIKITIRFDNDGVIEANVGGVEGFYISAKDKYMKKIIGIVFTKDFLKNYRKEKRRTKKHINQKHKANTKKWQQEINKVMKQLKRKAE